MEKVIIYLPEVEHFLNDLVDLLFEKEYFGFKEDAVLYVLKIKHYISQNISSFPAKSTPTEHRHHGEKYIFYKANVNTTWYIFFSQEEQTFFIQFITNNHSDFTTKFNL